MSGIKPFPEPKTFSLCRIVGCSVHEFPIDLSFLHNRMSDLPVLVPCRTILREWLLEAYQSVLTSIRSVPSCLNDHVLGFRYRAQVLLRNPFLHSFDHPSLSGQLVGPFPHSCPSPGTSITATKQSGDVYNQAKRAWPNRRKDKVNNVGETLKLQ